MLVLRLLFRRDAAHRQRNQEMEFVSALAVALGMRPVGTRGFGPHLDETVARGVPISVIGSMVAERFAIQ